MSIRNRGPFRVVQVESVEHGAFFGPVVVEALYAGDAFESARERPGSVVIDRNGDLLADPQSV